MADIQGLPTMPPEQLPGALARWDEEIDRRLQELDRRWPAGPRDLESYPDVVAMAAWAHGEWTRIHPFPNGNGRIGRLLVNAIAERYGWHPFMPIRPQPGPDYYEAAKAASSGGWQDLVQVFTDLLFQDLRSSPGARRQGPVTRPRRRRGVAATPRPALPRRRRP